MRLLYLASDAEPGDEVGFHDGFARLVAEGTLTALESISFYPYAARHGWDALWRHVVERARAIEAEAIFLQNMLRGQRSPRALETLRELPSRPFLFGHSGDAFGRVWGCKLPRAFGEVARHSDATFLCGMGRLARDVARRGARNIWLMPNGVCQQRFGAPQDPGEHASEFDVVFIGNRRRFRNPFNRYAAYPERDRVVTALWKRFGPRFGLFGDGWERWPCRRGPVPFHDQHRVYRRSRLGIGHAALIDIDYYCSNRTYVGIASGVPYVERYVPRLETLLEDGRHCFMYRSADEAVSLCESLLAREPDELADLARRAATYVLDRHSDLARVRAMVSIVGRAREAREAGKAVPPPEYDFFLDSIQPGRERAFSVVA